MLLATFFVGHCELVKLLNSDFMSFYKVGKYVRPVGTICFQGSDSSQFQTSNDLDTFEVAFHHLNCERNLKSELIIGFLR